MANLAYKALQVYQAQMDVLEHKAFQEYQVKKEKQETLVSKANAELLDPKAQMVVQDNLVIKANLVSLDPKEKVLTLDPSPFLR